MAEAGRKETAKNETVKEGNCEDGKNCGKVQTERGNDRNGRGDGPQKVSRNT